MARIGNGYDVHRLVEGRKLMLGGVEVPHSMGLDGHSDADVLIHAVCDAMLGAAGAGDLGKHFPDTDNQYKGISSLILLEKVGGVIHERGYCVGNIDATLVAQKPKLAPYVEEMKRNLCQALTLALHQVNIKATTTEKLGFAGREEGMAAYASVLLEENS